MRLSTVGLVLVVIGSALASTGVVALLGIAAKISGGGGAPDLLPEAVMVGFLVGGPLIFLLGLLLWLGVKIQSLLMKAKATRGAASESRSDSQSPAS